MSKPLIIVESPTKAKTLAKFLGAKYQIMASFGHIRDLPKSKMGVDETTMDVDYVVPKDKTTKVNELKKAAADASQIILATDPDREGEAIAWHLLNILTEPQTKRGHAKKIDYTRIVFHEITEHAIKEAIQSPRKIDQALVDAQQARRVLDRLVGYKLSPLLWKKIKTGLSAGRVQSIAVRLIVEREREIQAFQAEEYWTIEALCQVDAQRSFLASFSKLNGKKHLVPNQEEARRIVAALNNSQAQIHTVEKKEVRKYPVPPFTTSTLQQAASNKLGFSASRTMRAAQGLYEQGLITYMRTDSVNLATEAIDAARGYISQEFGKQYLPTEAKKYKTKAKVAQEAHEAIRPTQVEKSPERLAGDLEGDEKKLYTLIWNRFMACQMKEAIFDQTTIIVHAQHQEDLYELRASGRVIKFDGWLKVYGFDTEEHPPAEKADENTDNQSPSDCVLPEVSESEKVQVTKVHPEQHFTEPPPRYTEASLIKALEERSIGRPSTYAPTIYTIVERKYIEKDQRKLVPTPIAFAVNDFLVQNFHNIMDYSFTADLEQELDDIANGEREWKPVLKEFFEPFTQEVQKTETTAERMPIAKEILSELCPQCQHQLEVKFGRFGKFIACSNYPDCTYKRTFTIKLPDMKCPECQQGDVISKKSKKGRTFYGCSRYPECKWASWSKPTSPEAAD